jgi:hypothetical protein
MHALSSRSRFATAIGQTFRSRDATDELSATPLAHLDRASG